ncbi:hypothetical protein EIN_175530 [Entamoeba invadens IP1]|uniref:hypothetical protein n=1 Tax=Entamoeba invadens IP1 TaxID=370355 RepID=UPI0002C3D2EB|nr:hypothetical protein EIN_175530 [Entamoeba invadens IP1]ELP93766.1 hypothetical protein EIN_175530 [Entamoeba invadens IP1]|eukprot:XP_004260537.1 hypothetical protein EIN_175530 [Entamoeba invadens IP1]
MSKTKTATQSVVPHPHIPVKLSDEDLMFILEFFVSKVDFINFLCVTKKYLKIPEKYRTNPIKIDNKTTSLFPNLEVQKLYSWNDTQLKDIKLYEIVYPETYFHYYLKYFSVRTKVRARKIIYSAEDRVNYECMKGPGVVPEQITEISEKCFEECNKLTSLSIPDQVSVIGRNAFANCTSLKVLNLPENLKVIGDNCFLACNSLTTIKLGKNNEFKGKASFGIYMFLEKNNIKCNDVFYSVEDRRKYGNKIPEVCITLSEKCFAGCLYLTAITVPSTITYIGSRCFEGCKGLKALSLPSTVKVYDNVFVGCSCISALTIPGNFPKIDNSIFENVQMVKSIELTDCTQFDGMVSYSLAVIIEKGGIPCSTIKFTEEDRRLFGETVPKGVKELGEACFSGDFRVKSVVVPKSVTKLGVGCFKNCCSLTSVTLPSTIVDIPQSCFYQCPVLKSVKAKAKNLNYGKYCFFGCEKIKKSKKIPPECFEQEPIMK